jgi:phospholipid/cholesterol/gamma-HCH transport system ATP-binding protein
VGNKRTNELSTGMRRRVGFARAIALEPQILIFDEPTAGLDPVMVTVINQVISGLSHRSQTTAVTSTHDLNTARAVADRVVLVAKGELVADAPAPEFFSLDHPAVRQLLEGRPSGPLISAQEIARAQEGP